MHFAAWDLRWFSRLRSASGMARALWGRTLGRLTTYASPLDWNGNWDYTLRAAGFFFLVDSNGQINAYAVYAVRIFSLAFEHPLLAWRGVLHLRVERRVAMHVINSFSTRSPALISKLRELQNVVRSLRVPLREAWPASVANGWAERVPRQRDKDDMRPLQALHARLTRRYGEHANDRSSSALKTQCPRSN